MAGFTFTPLTPSAYLDRAAWVFRDRTLVTELPKTSTGKIQKHVLREQARVQKSGAGGPG